MSQNKIVKPNDVAEARSINANSSNVNKNSDPSNSGNNFRFKRSNYKLFPMGYYNFGIDAELKTHLYGSEPLETVMPHIIIKEYQPYLNFNYEDVLLAGLNFLEGAVDQTGTTGVDIGKFAASKLLGERGANALTAASSVIATNAYNIASRTAASNQYNDRLKRELTSSAEKLKNVEHEPIKAILELINAEFICQYNLPYTRENFINTADESGSWKKNALSDQMEKTAEKVKMAFENFRVNYPMTPTWSNSMETQKPIDLELTLYNNTIENLAKNYAFVTSLASGTFWLQYGRSNNISTNLYQIIVPGRFNYLMASMGIEVQFVGKLRRLTNEQILEFKRYVDNNGDEINIDDSVFLPDAFKLSLNIQSLVPNNFNTYLLGLKNNTSTNLTNTNKLGFTDERNGLIGIAAHNIGATVGGPLKDATVAVLEATVKNAKEVFKD